MAELEGKTTVQAAESTLRVLAAERTAWMEKAQRQERQLEKIRRLVAHALLVSPNGSVEAAELARVLKGEADADPDR